MAVDGIGAITTRIAEIQGALATMAVPTQTMSSRTASTAGTSFASVLAAELAGPTTAAGPGVLNAQGDPADLAAYGNGKIPDSALAEIGNTGERLWAPATAAFEKLSAAAARDGVSISINDSYRTYESQVDLVERKGLYSQGGLAAAPGTSDHGWGRSLDLGLDAKALAWMRHNASDYGFEDSTPRESWHWTYSPPS